MSKDEFAPWLANRGEGYVELNPVPANTVCVSITEPGRPAKLAKGFVEVLRLEFQDYDSLKETTLGSGVLRPGHKWPENAVLFDRTMAARTARFARRHRGKNILVHCAAGISRSGGIVEALLEAFPEYLDQGWKRYPNNLVKTLMKRALGLVPIGADEEESA